MALKPFNTIAGFSVGNTGSITVIDSVGNVSANFLSVTGNSNLGNYATANFFTGDGGLLTNISATTSNVISNGTSNVNIPVASGNINLSVGGNTNILVVTGTGVNVAGTLNATGNANVGNLGTSGLITATGNISASNLIAANSTYIGNAYLTKLPPDQYIEAWLYTGISSNVAAKETNVNGVAFDSTGANMYIIGLSDIVYQYSVSTPWDISTATFLQQFSVAAQETSPQAIEFKPDGTRMYILGTSGSGKVTEYSLGTAWNVTTASSPTNFVVGTQDTLPYGLAFKSDGTRMYIVGDTTNSAYQYNLSTAWSVNSASYTSGNTFSVSSQTTTPEGIAFNGDGTRMYIMGFDSGKLNQYNLSSAWDITTANYYFGYSPFYFTITPTGIWTSTANNRAYITDSSTDFVYQLQLDTDAIDVVNGKFVTSQDIISNNQTIANALTVTGTTRVGTVTATGAMTIQSALTVTGQLTASTTTASINLGTSQTSGTLTIGSATQTGTITVGQSTANQTLNLGTGATTGSNIKTINIGTGSTNATSNSNIFIGSGSAPSNVTFNASTVVYIANTGSALTVIGNTTSGNLSTGGILSVTGNANVGNLGTSGNITAGYYFGNGSQLTGISATTASALANGTSNISIPTADGNVNISVGGTSNVLVVTTTGANITGTLNSTGNANVGNIGATTGVFTNISGTLTTASQTNITSVGTLGNLTVTGNTTSGNFIGVFANGTSNVSIPAAGGNINISRGGTANVLVITGTGVNVAGTLNTGTGNANVGNLGTAGLILASGNITGANIIANNTVFAANIQAVPVVGPGTNFNILGSLASLTANATGYPTNIYGGTSNNAGKGGALTLNGGSVGNSSSTAGGGDVYVKGQTGGLLGTGGNVYIIAGGEDPVFHDGAYAIFYGSSSGINGNAEIYGGGANGTNIVGGSTIIAGGKSTGNANAGVLLFQTSTAGASGTTPQTYANRVVINSTTVNITTSTNSTSTTSGGLVVAGGVGISGNLYAGGIANITGNTTVGNLIGTVANGTSNIGIVNNGNISLVRSGTTRLLATNSGVTVTGSFSATSKSFLIEHPLNPDMYLQYGSLESPYHGVRLTGEGVVKNGKCTIQLPDYIKGLVKQEGSQVQLTNYKHGRTLYIDSIDVTENMFVVKSNWKLGELRFFWSFTAIRKDVEDLVVEY